MLDTAYWKQTKTNVVVLEAEHLLDRVNYYIMIEGEHSLSGTMHYVSSYELTFKTKQ